VQRRWLLFLFFLADVSFLIYEIAWVRQETMTFGVSIYTYSAVLTAYMGGMALGGFWIRIRADLHPQPLRLFAWINREMDQLIQIIQQAAMQANP
jgi:spermidine synthase